MNPSMMLAYVSVVFAFVLAFVRFRLFPKKSDSLVVSLFHPHSSGRGGGERVLWAAVDGLLRRPRISRIIIYSIDTDRDSILDGKNKTFNFSPSIYEKKIEFRKIHFSFLMEPKTWPIGTIIGQSIGASIVFMIALFQTPLSLWPNIFVDTTGCPFTLPVAKILTGATVAAYIHYPTMSNDMFQKIQDRKSDFNNRPIFTKIIPLFYAKILYYKIFLFMYKICGWFTDIVIANSNWTGSRIEDVWPIPNVKVLYPPAAIGSGFPVKDISTAEDKGRLRVLVSLAQFRPEKNHFLQLGVYRKILDSLKPDEELIQFWLMGGVRNEADSRLVNDLKDYAKKLGIPNDNIRFIINAEWSEVSRNLRTGMCAIHTMTDEHFGISLLEFLEAKIPIVAHRSGGPEKDILLPNEKFGFLASSEDEFAEKILHVYRNWDSLKSKRIDAYNSLNRFMNDSQFGIEFAKLVIGK
jgi:alpha-1,2-mannosyltransferase